MTEDYIPPADDLLPTEWSKTTRPYDIDTCLHRLAEAMKLVAIAAEIFRRCKDEAGVARCGTLAACIEKTARRVTGHNALTQQKDPS